MEKEKLLKISIIIALFGIWLLLFLSSQIEPKLMNIQNITKENLNDNIKVLGNITKVRDLGGFQIITLKDITGEITIITNSEIGINKTNNVLIFGKVQEYNSTIQIEVNKIILL